MMTHATNDSAERSEPAPIARVGSVAGSASGFAELEDMLTPAAKHAYETFLYAFWLPNQTMTMGELRDALRKLYGDAVDRELEQHFHDRRERVLPNSNVQRRSGGQPASPSVLKPTDQPPAPERSL